MKVEISNGELLDKISILELKMLKIENKKKLVNIKKEFYTLNPLCVTLFEKFGSQLWDIEDWIRDCEREKRFDAEFIQLARSVYVTNDRRSEVKKEINKLTKSGLIEEKSYKDYK